MDARIVDEGIMISGGLLPNDELSPFVWELQNLIEIKNAQFVLVGYKECYKIKCNFMCKLNDGDIEKDVFCFSFEREDGESVDVCDATCEEQNYLDVIATSVHLTRVDEVCYIPTTISTGKVIKGLETYGLKLVPTWWGS